MKNDTRIEVGTETERSVAVAADCVRYTAESGDFFRHREEQEEDEKRCAYDTHRDTEKRVRIQIGERVGRKKAQGGDGAANVLKHSATRSGVLIA